MLNGRTNGLLLYCNWILDFSVYTCFGLILIHPQQLPTSTSFPRGLACPCRRGLLLESIPSPCLRTLCFLRASLHGLKNSCPRASSALILSRGFTIKHLSARSNSDLGMASMKSFRRAFRAHHSRRLTGDKYFTSNRSCHQKKKRRLQLLQNESMAKNFVLFVPLEILIHGCAALLLPRDLHCPLILLSLLCSC